MSTPAERLERCFPVRYAGRFVEVLLVHQGEGYHILPPLNTRCGKRTLKQL